MLDVFLAKGDRNDPTFREECYKKFLSTFDSAAQTLSARVSSVRLNYGRLRRTIEEVERHLPGTVDLDVIFSELPELERRDDDIPEVPPQVEAAPVFVVNPQGVIENDPDFQRRFVTPTPTLGDLHSEVRRLAGRLATDPGVQHAGSNTAGRVKEASRLLVEAIGETITEVRPGLLIPRGEALRQFSAQQELLDDDRLSDVAPLPDSLRGDLLVLVRAYNAFVASDQALRSYDEAQYGPDTQAEIIDPGEALAIAASAQRTGIVAESAVEVLKEEARVVPPNASSSDRRARRFSEGIRNLLKVIFGRAILWTGGAVTGGYAAAQWFIQNKDWFLRFFADDERALSVIRWLIEHLEKLPIAG